jgi:nitronate monooxygenase
MLDITIHMGVSGVQMGTRFVASIECDAPEAFKQKYIGTNNIDDLVLVKTTVGLEGRAIRNKFTEAISGICRRQCPILY